MARINRNNILLLATLLSLLLACPHALGWETVRESSDASLSVRTGDDVEAVKMQLQIAAPVAQVLCVLQQPELNPRWVPRSRGARQLDSDSDDEQLIHFRSDFPWPFRDRDAVMGFRTERQGDQVRIRMESHPDALPEQPGYRRVHHAQGEWRLRPLPENRTEVTYINDFNPELPLPAFIVNGSLRDNTWATGMALKQLLEQRNDSYREDQHRDHDHVEECFQPDKS